MEVGRDCSAGTVLTETVFAVNGIGRFLVTSIAFRDYPAVAGVVLFIALGSHDDQHGRGRLVPPPRSSHEEGAMTR